MRHVDTGLTLGTIGGGIVMRKRSATPTTAHQETSTIASAPEATHNYLVIIFFGRRRS